MKWVEISNQSEKIRYLALSEQMNQKGLVNELEFIQTDLEQFPQVARAAMNEFAQIRVGGLLRDAVLSLNENIPAVLLSLRMADALVQSVAPTSPGSSQKNPHSASSMRHSAIPWWPRCYMIEGLTRALVGDGDLDLNGSAFIMGCTPSTRAVVGSLARIGFRKFAISGSDETLGRTMVSDFAACYFRSEFQFVPKNLIAQLPSVYSIAVSAEETSEASGVATSSGLPPGDLNELFFFNFLKPGGRWLDLSMTPHLQVLQVEAEARAVGAQVQNGIVVAAWTDAEWVKQTFGVDLDPIELGQVYREKFGWK